MHLYYTVTTIDEDGTSRLVRLEWNRSSDGVERELLLVDEIAVPFAADDEDITAAIAARATAYIVPRFISGWIAPAGESELIDVETEVTLP
jgi:hypothetical protein